MGCTTCPATHDAFAEARKRTTSATSCGWPTRLKGLMPAERCSAAAPDPAALTEAAHLLARTKAPLVIAQRGAGDAENFAVFADWASRWGIAVCSWWATHLAISTEHPCHVGADPGPWLAEADVVLVLDCLSPWWPDKHPLAPGAKVINTGPDPIFSRFPVRNFPSDISITGENAVAVPALVAAMENESRDEAVLAARRDRLAAASAKTRDALRKNASDVGCGITNAYVSLRHGEALTGLESSVFSELGAQLAEPERLCVATLGDGSYIFANPTACHQIAETLQLPVLIIVLNNAEWGAVRASVKGLYPEGYAARANTMPLTALQPSTDFAQTAAASRCWARNVTEPEELDTALADALRIVREERRPALLNVAVLPD